MAAPIYNIYENKFYILKTGLITLINTIFPKEKVKDLLLNVKNKAQTTPTLYQFDIQNLDAYNDIPNSYIDNTKIKDLSIKDLELKNSESKIKILIFDYKSYRNSFEAYANLYVMKYIQLDDEIKKRNKLPYTRNEMLDTQDEHKKKMIESEFKSKIISSDLNYYIKTLYKSIFDFMVVQKISTTEFENSFFQYQFIYYDSVTDIEYCPNCRVQYIIDYNQSALICSECNEYKQLVGVILDDTNTIISDGTILKKNSYKPSVHCVNHINDLLGKKYPTQLDGVIKKIKNWYYEHNINENNANGKNIRVCLKDIKETKYNRFTPSIVRYLSGRNEELLSSSEIEHINEKFNQCINIMNISTDKKKNIKYYPYYIFKIIEDLLVNDQERLKKIASVIHFQSDNTRSKNDIEWKYICDTLGDIIYRDTNIHNYIN